MKFMMGYQHCVDFSCLLLMIRDNTTNKVGVGVPKWQKHKKIKLMKIFNRKENEPENRKRNGHFFVVSA